MRARRRGRRGVCCRTVGGERRARTGSRSKNGADEQCQQQDKWCRPTVGPQPHVNLPIPALVSALSGCCTPLHERHQAIAAYARLRVEEAQRSPTISRRPARGYSPKVPWILCWGTSSTGHDHHTRRPLQMRYTPRRAALLRQSGHPRTAASIMGPDAGWMEGSTWPAYRSSTDTCLAHCSCLMGLHT